MTREFIRVLYEFPAGVDPEKQGRMLAVGQTTGSFRPDEASRFESFTGILEDTSRTPEGRGRAHVAFPSSNVSGDIGSLLVMILGKYSLAGPVRVVSLELPESYGTRGRFGDGRDSGTNRSAGSPPVHGHLQARTGTCAGGFCKNSPGGGDGRPRPDQGRRDPPRHPLLHRPLPHPGLPPRSRRDPAGHQPGRCSMRSPSPDGPTG
ncbi:MAG: hypothetical protein D084_Lepto4C00403G0003 [Leptospirillum sp. Group IV 'UBA BS']|nr:MAG: hypothetical protein D084_Lepto4C00403G0003 [Leptospirillum sp. Group IV 'UBA BS']